MSLHPIWKFGFCGVIRSRENRNWEFGSHFLVASSEQKIKWKESYFPSAIDDSKLCQGMYKLSLRLSWNSRLDWISLLRMTMSARFIDIRRMRQQTPCTQSARTMHIRNCLESVWNGTQVNGIEHRMSRDICAADSLIASTRKGSSNRYLVDDGQNSRRQQRASRETCSYSEIMYHSIRISSLQKLIYLFTVWGCKVWAVIAICMHQGMMGWWWWSDRRKICVSIRQPSELRFSVRDCRMASVWLLPECTHTVSAPFVGISHYRCSAEAEIHIENSKVTYFNCSQMNPWNASHAECSECTRFRPIAGVAAQTYTIHVLALRTVDSCWSCWCPYIGNSLHAYISNNGQVKTLSKHSPRQRWEPAKGADDYILSSQMRPVCARRATNNQTYQIL